MNFDLNTIWFILVGVLFTGYAMLDGFDLGMGAVHMFTKDDAERRVMLNAIGPVWDGNEVWLVTGGGALFAAFPNVYATVFSGFYLAFMLLLASLILFTFIYFLLFSVFLYLLNDKIQHGPHDEDLIPSGKLALPTHDHLTP